MLATSLPASTSATVPFHVARSSASDVTNSSTDATHAPPVLPVPLLDVSRGNNPLRDEILQTLADVYDSGRFLHGPQVTLLEEQVARISNTKHAVGCASGSDALLLALMALGIGPGDEVIVPSFTFFATASCVHRLGAKIVFADIDPRTYNIDPVEIQANITDRTRAIIPVHLFGQAAAMDAICNVADGCDIPVIEDCAQAIGGAYHGRPLGSWGQMSCTSFYPTKNLGGLGDGGMLTLNSDILADRLRLLAGHGMRPRYHHSAVGINSRLDTLQAAALLVKIQYLQQYTNARQENAQRYFELFQQSSLADVCGDRAVGLPYHDPAAFHVWNQFSLRIGNGQRDHLRNYLQQRYATTSDPLELDHCRELVELAPDVAAKQALLEGLLRAFEGRTLPPLPESLSTQLATYQESLGDAGLVIGLQQQDPGAVTRAIAIVRDAAQPLALRSALVRSLGESHPAAAQATLLQLANGGTNEPALQRVALVALRPFDDDAIGGQLVGQFGGSISAEHSLRDTACRTLATRKAWAVALLNEVLAWRLRPKDIPVDVAQQLRAYDDPQVALLAERALGKAVVISSEEKLQQMEHLQQLWKRQSADPIAGKEVFAKKCGVCHQLFGEGNTIGPALDAYERGNPRFWLVAIVEPSAEIREGFQSYAALTVDGRLVTGMLAEQTAHGVTIRSADNHMTTIAVKDLEALRALKTSLMPEDVLQDLDDQQLGDLFAYLRSGAR